MRPTTISALALTLATLAVRPLAAQPAATRFARGTQPADVMVCVEPLGPIDGAITAAVARGITAAYGFRARVLPGQPLPRTAYYRPRKRYKADKLLDHLAADVVPASGCAIVLGVTTADISITTETHADWGILGLAYLDSQVAVISTFRAARKVSRTKMIQRTVKTAHHELGHALGLPHDDSVAGCMMNDARGTVATVDAEQGVPCAHERAALEARLGVTLPVVAALDWAAVLGR
jgi:archaemetzincin